MMDYGIFKAVVKEKFSGYLPEEYRDAEIRTYPAKKVNRTLDALTVLPEGREQVFPTIYINEMYEHYQISGDLETVLREAAQQYAQSAEMVKDQNPGEIMDEKMKHFKENVIMCLINTEQNREMLRKISSIDNDTNGALVNWQSVYEIIDNLYAGFYSRLHGRHGNILTDKEEQIIVLMMAGFSTKEISVITMQTTATIYVRKSSIRKKLGVPVKEDIVAFLRQETSV